LDQPEHIRREDWLWRGHRGRLARLRSQLA